jgi:di/tricarboxylate transporter
MEFEQAAVAAILVGMFAAFFAGRWRHDVVALAGLMAAVLTGVVPAASAFSGFASPAVITVAAVLVLTRTLARSGVFDVLGGRLLAGASGTTAQIAILCATGAAISAFINNIGALALLMPVALAVARRHGRSPSLYLLPLSYATLLGGMSTLIGTPANLLVSEFRAAATGEPFAMFAFAPVGAPLALLGVAYLAAIGWRRVPSRRDGGEPDIPLPAGGYETELTVAQHSPHMGRSVGALERERGLQVYAIVRDGVRVFGRLAQETLRAGDVVLLKADAATLRRLVEAEGMVPHLGPEAEDGILVEAVMMPDAVARGSSARTLDLWRRWGVTLVAASRRGRRSEGRLAEAPLSTGDVLLVHGNRDAVLAALAELGCLPLADRRLTLQPRRALAGGAIFGTAVTLAALGMAPPEIGFSLAVLALLAARMLRPAEMYDAVDWPVLVLLAVMIPMGGALIETGTAGLLAGIAATATGDLGPHVLLGLVLGATMLITPVLNNPATVTVMAPVALDLAAGLQVSPDPFLIAVAIGASCDFLTPFGHHNNAVVMGPGGYRFGDYARVGRWLELLVFAVAVVLIPLAWNW